MEPTLKEEDYLRIIEQSKEFVMSLTSIIESQKKDVEFSKAMQDNKGYVTMQKASGSLFKYVKEHTGVSLGRNHLFDYLRSMKILQSEAFNHNIPYQRYISAGYFKLITTPKSHGLVTTTLVSGKGLQYIQDRLIKYLQDID